MKTTQKKTKTIYYKDELNDDFAKQQISKNVVDDTFKFIHKNKVWKFVSNLIYYLIAVPIVWFYTSVFLQVKFVNKKAVKSLRKNKVRYFMYGNHIGWLDAFTPNLISLPTRNKIIVSAETVSIKGIRWLVQMLGAVPTPTQNSGMLNFAKAIDYYHQNYNITIYPEAHIWPYYTGVRNFRDTSFWYPAKTNSPIVVFFTAYSKPKGFLSWFRKANIKIFVSNPIYPDPSKTKKENQKYLRDKAYSFMKEMSLKYSTYSVIEYKHISEENVKENLAN